MRVKANACRTFQIFIGEVLWRLFEYFSKHYFPWQGSCCCFLNHTSHYSVHDYLNVNKYKFKWMKTTNQMLPDWDGKKTTGVRFGLDAGLVGFFLYGWSSCVLLYEKWVFCWLLIHTSHHGSVWPKPESRSPAAAPPWAGGPWRYWGAAWNEPSSSSSHLERHQMK